MIIQEHISRIKARGFKYKEDKEIAIRSLEAWGKVKEEIKDKYEGCSICEWFIDYDYDENDVSEYRSVGDISDIIAIIDKHLTEVSNNDD